MIYKVYNDRYVAAILASTVSLADWLKKAGTEKIFEKQLVVEGLHWATYPFYLIEVERDNKRMFVGSKDEDGEVKSLKNLFSSTGFKVLATYYITKDFVGDPNNPGNDYMGILDHEHEEEDETI